MKYLLLLAISIFFTSCLTKSYFDERTNMLSNQIDNIQVSDCEELSMLDGNAFVGMGKVEYFSRSESKYGIIVLANINEKFSPYDGVIYQPTISDNFNRGDTVYFNILINKGIAQAVNISTDRGAYIPNGYEKEHVSFNLHSKLWHPGPTGEHRYGHIKPKNGGVKVSRYGYDLIEGTIEYYEDETRSVLSNDPDDSFDAWILDNKDYDYFPSTWPNPNSYNRYAVGFLTESNGSTVLYQNKKVAIEFLTEHSH